MNNNHDDNNHALHGQSSEEEWSAIKDVKLVDSADARELHAEIGELDAAWTAASAAELAREDARAEAIARSAVHDESGRDQIVIRPTETACLECGAVYESPGKVEAVGMACRRCG